MTRSLRRLDVYPITTRQLEVLRVSDVTPGMRRVTLGGPQLAAHTAENGFPVAAFRSEGFDDEGKLFLKHPDADVAVVPEQNDGVINWPRNEHLLFRTYTVRRWDPEAGEMDLDFVKHGVGPATTWAYTVQPGEKVQWAGPKMSASHPVGVNWTLVAGDETALPAIGRWLEEWPEGERGQVFIEVGEQSHRQELPVPDGVEVTWLSRDGAEAGTTSLLFDAIRSADWWDGKVFAWVAGEALTLTPIRRWLRDERGLAREQMEVAGYWRRQKVAIDEETGEQDIDATEDDGHVFHEMTEIIPAFAVRVAASIGLAEAFDGGAKDAAALAEATGADPLGLAKLVRYLAAIGITEETDDGTYRLTDLGRSLEVDHLADALNLELADAQAELTAALSLLSAVRTGTGDHEQWLGARFDQWLLSRPDLLALRVADQAELAGYVSGAVATSPAFAGARRILVSGVGAGTFAVELTEVLPEARVDIVALPSEIEALRVTHGDPERVTYVAGTVHSTPPAEYDVVLVPELMPHLPDADVVHALSNLAGSLAPGGSLLVFGEALDPALVDEHDLEHDLLDFALHGGGARSHEEYIQLFERAGMPEVERTTVGWGYSLYRATVR